MADDALGDDLVIDDAFIRKKVKWQGAEYGIFLNHLSNDEKEKLRDDHVIDIIDNHFNADEVTFIDLTLCPGITDVSIKHISTRCTNLHSLIYDECTRCTDAALQAIVQHCSHLWKLHAENAGISKIPEDIGEKLPRLSDLNLSNNKIKTIPLSMIAFLDDMFSLKFNFNIDNNPVIDQTVQQGGMDAIIAHLIRKEGFTYENAIGGISDSPTFDPDRLGVSVYAEAISAVAENAETPENSLCVALFGRWGAGKTFLYKLIRQARKAKADEKNRDRLQELEEERKDQRNILLKSNERSLQTICNLIALLCCCCQKHKSESIATLVAFPLLCPIWICLYLISLLVFFYIELFSFIVDKIEYKKGWVNVRLWLVSLPITLPGILFFLVREIMLSKKIREMMSTIDKDNDALPPWRDVRDILTGNASLHSKTLFKDRSSCWSILQLVILSVTRPIFKFMQSKWNPISFFWWSFSSRNRQFEVRDDMTKAINVTCTAWLYNGTDLLWAAIMEEIWTGVEAEYGTYTVRFHRFLISISSESKSDDLKVKESKRKTALLMLNVKVICYFVIAAVITVFFDDIVNFSDNNLSKLSNLILPASLYTIPSIPLLKDTIKLFLHLFGKSQGTQIYQQAQALAKHQRFDFSGKTGFMGTVKTEIEYLYDFLITQHIVDWIHQVLRPGRLNIMLDDLDRCDAQTIMDMLEAAMLLLLIDAPVTCWIPIDSQVIVASIEKLFGQQFLQEGIDGYSFLGKIIQLPFCIPDLDSYRKVAFLEKIFEKDELSPYKLYQRLHFLDQKAGLEEFKDLLPNNQKFMKGMKYLKVPEDLSPEELVPVLEKMVELPGGILSNYNEDTEACFDSPKEVLEKVKKQFSSKRALEGKLEEEFLHFVSVGIQKLLARSRLKEGESSTTQTPQQDRGAPGTTPNPTSDDVYVEGTPGAAALGSDLDIANNPLIFTSNVDVQTTATPGLDLGMATNTSLIHAPSSDGDVELGMISSLDKETPNDNLSSHRGVQQLYNNIYHPIMDPSERSWFNRYADDLVGKPRKMKRIINSYMVSRIVAKKLRPKLAGQKEFGEKLLKLIILCEQWPYRMAWFLVVAENIQQEKSLQDQLPQNPIGDSLSNIISKLSGVAVKDIMDLPLLTVYHNLVQSVIHSPETAESLLQRDGDPQVFEILLAKPDAPLKLKDVASSSSAYDSTSQTTTVRPYLFNMQMYMTDKVQNYVDNCMVHLVENKSKKMNHAVYQKKPDFFNQEYDPIPSPIEIVEADSKKPRFFNQEYPTPSPAVEIEEASSKTDLHERRLRVDVEIAQLEADEALRERKSLMEELSVLIQAEKSSDLIQSLKEDFVKAKKVSDEKNARLQAAKTALVKFQSGITVNE